jgi:hypothetical protein
VTEKLEALDEQGEKVKVKMQQKDKKSCQEDFNQVSCSLNLGAFIVIKEILRSRKI